MPEARPVSAALVPLADRLVTDMPISDEVLLQVGELVAEVKTLRTEVHALRAEMATMREASAKGKGILFGAALGIGFAMKGGIDFVMAHIKP